MAIYGSIEGHFWTPFQEKSGKHFLKRKTMKKWRVLFNVRAYEASETKHGKES
jgi:hypothetical protein